MLTRNGEYCEHPVPDFPGFLTDSEQKAYDVALASVQWLLKEFNEGAKAITEVEKQIPKLAQEASEKTSENTLIVRGPESEWQVHRMLHKSARNELLLCSRHTGGGAEFGIVEQFAHNSIYAQANGNTDLLMTSNRATLLLQDYVESERRVLQMFRKDIEATVEDTLAEKFPNMDCSRVVKAISARCGAKTGAKNENALSEKQTRGVKVRF